MAATGKKTLLCIPSKSSEAWLAAAVLPNHQNLLQDLECATDIENRLAQLPKTQRIKKSRREYLPHAPTITANWARVRQICSQAEAFHLGVDALAIDAA